MDAGAARFIWSAIEELSKELERPLTFRATGIGGRSASLKWPHLYDILRAKGYDKSKSAAISNAKRFQRKSGTTIKGLNIDDVKKFNQGKLDPKKLARLQRPRPKRK